MKGVTLVPNSVFVLSLDGTLVFVEDIQPTYAAVLALPEQPAARSDQRVFTPGRVGAKKISPFAGYDREIKFDDLSERNQSFIMNFEEWRRAHGPFWVHRTPEELAAQEAAPVTVTKAGPKKKLRRTLKCATCNQQPGHPNHPSDHEFVEPAASAADATADATPRAAKEPRAKKERAAKGDPAYTLTSDDMTKARAQKRGERYNDGNRSHRVVRALASLPGRTGTVDDIIGALLKDGAAMLANPEKVVKRTISQLSSAEFGACVVKA